MSPALPTQSGQSWAQPSRSSGRPRRVGRAAPEASNVAGTASQPTPDRRPATRRRDVDEPFGIEDLGQQLDAVDDPRSGPAEVGRPVEREDRPAASGGAGRRSTAGRPSEPIRGRSPRRWKPHGIRNRTSRIDLGDGLPGRLGGPSRRPRRGGPSPRLAGSAPGPSGRRQTAGRATRARRHAAPADRRHAAPRRAAQRRRAAPGATRRRRSAASSTSVIAPTVVIVLKMPSIEVGSSETTVMSASIAAGDLVDLAVADRADAAQLLGQDEVGLGRGEGVLVERVQRRAAMHRGRDRAWMSREPTAVELVDAPRDDRFVEHRRRPVALVGDRDKLVLEPDARRRSR